MHWSSKGSRSLHVWNTWEVNGVAHAWLGDAGIRVTEKDPGAFELRCSDGEGEPDFSNLTVEVFAE